MRITKDRLIRIIKEELSALDEIYWSQVGVRPRSSDGSMGLAKYPGEWAAGRKFVLVEDEDDDEDDDSIDEQDFVGGFSPALGSGTQKQRRRRRQSAVAANAAAFGGGTVE